MKGCEEAEAIHTVSEAASYIQKVGFIPLFSNTISGFSLEEHTAPSQWWSDDPETDPWIWRQTLSSNPDIAYGKFFGRNAGFISKDWFPVFANYRRNGYDFDALFEDELASYRSKKIMDVFELNDEAVGRQIMSSEVKSLAGFSKDGGEKNFEGVITDLQMQTYLIVGDFRQKKNKKGQPFGWHIALMETPETKWGREYVTSCYPEDPAISWQRITEKMKSGFQNAGDKEIIKMLGIKYPGAESKPVGPEKEKKTPKPRIIRPQELPWPENLMTEIGLTEVFPETGTYAALTADQMVGLIQVLGDLKDNEQTVIRLRYEEHKSLQETADNFGLSKERIRQITAKALRKLRHPSRLTYYRDGFQGMLDIKDRKRKTIEEEQDPEKKIAMLKGISFSECGLSSHSDFCLHLAGMGSLGEVAEIAGKMPEKLLSLRSVGRISLREVLDKLETYGFYTDEVRKVCGLDSDRPEDISELELPIRLYNLLKRAGMDTVPKIEKAMKEDPIGFLKTKGLGVKSRSDLFEILESIGIDCKEIEETAFKYFRSG